MRKPKICRPDDSSVSSRTKPPGTNFSSEKTQLEREMEEGYRAEAAASSLDPEWTSFEVEGA
jgi:hypothetical protein